jgi:hypothetical protein
MASKSSRFSGLLLFGVTTVTTGSLRRRLHNYPRLYSAHFIASYFIFVDRKDEDVIVRSLQNHSAKRDSYGHHRGFARPGIRQGSNPEITLYLKVQLIPATVFHLYSKPVVLQIRFGGYFDQCYYGDCYLRRITNLVDLIKKCAVYVRLTIFDYSVVCRKKGWYLKAC